MPDHTIASRISQSSRLAFVPEHEAVAALVEAAAPLDSLSSAIQHKARTYATAIRRSGPIHGAEALLSTYRLDSEEGVALMCLAEALLRIPDAYTADQLIQSALEGHDWRTDDDEPASWLASASRWGLLVAGRLVDLGDAPQAGISAALRRLAARLGEPAIRQALKLAMRLIGNAFVLGETIEDGLSHATAWESKGFRFSYDILGEGARTEAQAHAAMDAYLKAIPLLGKSAAGLPILAAPSMSVKLSALHPRYSLSQRGRVLAELKPRLKELLLAARRHHISLSIDAEEANRLDIELLLFAELSAEPELAGWNGLGFVLQAYQKRAVYVIDLLAELARAHGRVIPLRLVKGAYWDGEIKHAQIMGLPAYPVFTRKEHTDLSYLACAAKLMEKRACFYPQFATHNAHTIAAIEELASHHGLTRDAFEFQRLHGMGEALHDLIVTQYSSRIYAPIGPHKDLLAYLIRRLLENGANTSFVHLLMDDDIPMEELIADPIARAREGGGYEHPGIPLPGGLYGDRRNSPGADLGYLHFREPLEKSLAAHCDIVARIGDIAETPVSELPVMLAESEQAVASWSCLAAARRAAILEQAADLLEIQQHEFIALLVHEAFKTIPDAISELREAADFLRYYALQARRLLHEPYLLAGPTGESNRLSLHPRGLVACISPWNFPLAIFIGQVAAALATGNRVIAKPAEQTPRIAVRAVALLHRAGVPETALQLAIGRGDIIGAALVRDPRINAVVFTGSVAVAGHIQQSLAARAGAIIPFIAETGGINAMVVDSSALPEQAVDDIILSAFGSAGQRCSALRVLFVQEDIADVLLALLAGAMRELNVGTSSQFAADIGPVIDREAQKELLAHIERLKREATLVGAAVPSDDTGSFVTPHAFEITDIRQIAGEIFGPVLHILRFRRGDLARVAEQINALGYGLTFGLHSRIPEHIDFFCRHIRAGNIYINRSMIGAVVGVQPFGGEGLSGTGPKAGGPHYLLRFLIERTVTVNTAAIGGNIQLLA
jgi:RHH-type proline utilization regulon transcriptional repressor/proline dehydrogenase/delta 1-pyrroline-5-carboxylate dehydrogenase